MKKATSKVETIGKARAEAAGKSGEATGPYLAKWREFAPESVQAGDAAIEDAIARLEAVAAKVAGTLTYGGGEADETSAVGLAGRLHAARMIRGDQSAELNKAWTDAMTALRRACFGLDELICRDDSRKSLRAK